MNRARHRLAWRLNDLALPAILLLAAFLRLFGLQYGQYGSDDERLWAAALRGIADHTLPLQGIKSSIGLGNGPFQVYLMMPAALITQAPIAGAVIVALLNVLGVFVLYRFLLEFFGKRPALLGSLLLAVNSWAVIFSRRMQAQDLILPFEILFFWAAARWLVGGRGRDLVLMLLWLAILSQVYILGLLYFAFAGLVLLFGWRRLRPLPLLVGAAVWGALSFRYLTSIILPNLWTFRSVGGGTSSINFDSLGLALLMATHKGFQTIAGQAGSVLDATSSWEGLLVSAEGLIFAAGVAYSLFELVRAIRSRKRERSMTLGLLLLWAAVPVALFARHSIPLYPYYFVSLMPTPAIFSALFLDRFWPRFGAAATGVLTANSLALAGIFFAVIPGYYTHNDYGLPYQETFAIAQQVEALAAHNGVQRIYVDGDMDPSDVMTSVLKRAGLHVFWFDDYRTPEFAAPAPGSSAVYLTMADDTQSAQFLHSQFSSDQRFERQLAGEGVVVRAYLLSSTQVRAALSTALPEPLVATVGNGMKLEAFRAGNRLIPGSTLHAAIEWNWPGGQRPAALQYSMFAHLVDSQGVAVAQVDRPLAPSSDWLPGESVVQWLDLALPENLAPGRYGLNVGVYDTQGTVRQTLTDGQGKFLGSSVTLGPLAVAPAASPATSGFAPASIAFGDGIALSGYQASWSGGALTLSLKWQALATPSKDYTVYVHVVDAAGKAVAQSDSQPRNGDFPTSAWRKGDVLDDVHRLPVPPGSYMVEVGLYSFPSLQRLSGGPLRFPLKAS